MDLLTSENSEDIQRSPDVLEFSLDPNHQSIKKIVADVTKMNKIYRYRDSKAYFADSVKRHKNQRKSFSILSGQKLRNVM